MLVNVENIKELFGGDTVFISSLVNQFSSDVNSSVSKITTGIQVKDWETVRLAAHKAISSSSVFEIDELNKLLMEIESNAKNHENLDEINELAIKYEQLSYLAINELSREFTKAS